MRIGTRVLILLCRHGCVPRHPRAAFQAMEHAWHAKRLPHARFGGFPRLILSLPVVRTRGRGLNTSTGFGAKPAAHFHLANQGPWPHEQVALSYGYGSPSTAPSTACSMSSLLMSPWFAPRESGRHSFDVNSVYRSIARCPTCQDDRLRRDKSCHPLGILPHRGRLLRLPAHRRQARHAARACALPPL